MTIPQQSKGQLVFDAVPIIDFSLAETDPARYFEQLRFALEDVGFGVFVNVPGFEDAFQKELFGIADRLFKKPQEWKDAHGTANSYALRGYFRADDIPGDHKVSMRDGRQAEFTLTLLCTIGLCRGVPLWTGPPRA
ncbi:hypothetical protein PHLGIDRAFT_421226 [Phlebiopsis gigantea 11061_1 CR5-6]|uniref:Non-haem dioxygenase N-terminal domain-containing protein n=1 Tax=Phlebiopsis gigantea (strain 11061_1 CR5-6) TaxID=745531 RepID=A0A0C3RYY6_PHLG1|nr:hypothetical protein PHLGIDRAFT_421226 [Phlebiopsis gigantea 11061_1 CR5-6]